jgi:hypothetical protein
VANLKLRIIQDQHTPNPREDHDYMSTIATWHRTMVLGDVQPKEDPQDYLEGLPKDAIVRPLYMYEHGSIGLSLSNHGYPYDCPWDAGQVGYIWVSRERARKCLGEGHEDPYLEELVIEAFQAEIDEYTHYLNGDCWGYVLEESHECPECHHTHAKEIDSVWGFIGSTDPKQNGMADYLPEGWENADIEYGH